jgi:hypothetical protein
MPQAIKTAIYTKLTADQTAGTLYAAVGGRIFENEGQDDSALPLLVYEVTSSATSNVMTGDKEIVQAVATLLYGHKRLGSAALGSIEGKLYSLLNGISMTTTGYDRGVVLATSRDIRQNFEDVLSSQSVYRIEATST